MQDRWVVLRWRDGRCYDQYFDTEPEAVEYAAHHQEDKFIIAKVMGDRESLPVLQRGRRSRDAT